MQKIVIVLSLICVLVLSGCVSNKSEKNPVPEDETVSITGVLNNSNIHTDFTKPANYSFLDKSFEGQIISVTGLLSGAFDSGFILTANPESKSAVTFILNEDEESKEIYKQLSEKIGTVVTIEGQLIDASNIWSKVMTVQSISE